MTIEANERTRAIYEEIAGYPKPPLVPIPAPDDLEPIVPLGLRPGPAARRIVGAATTLTGLRAFQRRLPETVEQRLRNTDIRGSYLFAPVVAATLALEDDPRGLDPIERAVTLLLAARSLYDDIASARLPPDCHNGEPLEMGQYLNLFATSLIVDGKQARMFKSTNTTRITIAVGGRLYALEAGHLGTETTAEQLHAALAELVRTAQGRPLADGEFTASLLTSADHATQMRAFQRHAQIPINRESLETLRHSFLTLCLDLDSHPTSHAEAAMAAQTGNPGNRWFHSSLQLVVFGNGRACAICNFSAYLDGNTMMRGGAEIQQRAAALPVPSGKQDDRPRLPPATELRWQINPAAIERARLDLGAVQDNQQATFEITGAGRSTLSAPGLEPVPLFITALEMAARRLLGQASGITQFLVMSRYRCMDLATADVATPEVLRFVEYLESGQVQREQALDLLREANRTQQQAMRKARSHLPFDDMLTLFMQSRGGIGRRYAAFVAMVAVLLLRLSGSFKPSRREILVSHPEIYPQIPVIGRPGVRLPYVKHFGLHYQILEDRIVVTVMPSTSWTIPNSQLIAELDVSLRQLQSLVEHA